MNVFDSSPYNITPIPLIYPEIISEEKNKYTNILLIDNQTASYQTFVDSANSSTFPIVYSIQSSKTELLTLLQKMFTSISRIAICFASFKEKNIIFMDSKPLFLNNEQTPYSENLEFIISIIKEFSVKNIDYLACNTLNYTNWNNYYQKLSENTGVIVGASNDKTGNIKYGGNWIMESTSEDIELVYFTKNIEYYQYLLDTSNFAYVDTPYGVCIDRTNTYMYATSYNTNIIHRIRMSNPQGDNIPWVTGINNPSGIVIDNTNTYIYVTTVTVPTAYTIIRIKISDATYSTWVAGNQGLNQPYGIAIDSTNSYIYVTNYGNNTISKINYVTPGNIEPAWIKGTQGLSKPWGITIDKNDLYMYVTNSDNRSISKIGVSIPFFSLKWAEYLSGLGILNLRGITMDSTNTYLYVANFDTSLMQINIKNPNNYTVGYYAFDYAVSMTYSNNYIYSGSNSNGGRIAQVSVPNFQYVCFKEDSKILTDKGYIHVQNLRKGDLVKTLRDGYKPINMIGKREIYHIASKDRIPDQLYKYSNSEYPEVFEPLIITGCHSILVDNFVSEEQKEKTIKMNGKIYVTDHKYRLPACADEKASVYEISGNYTIYHFALENDNYYMNYGIFANGLLVETCSKRYLKELSNMELIE